MINSFSPLFYTIDGENVNFIYPTKLPFNYKIASGSNIGGLIDFVQYSNAAFCATKEELQNKLFDLNYANYKLPLDFPCAMVKGGKERIANDKKEYILWLESGFISKEQIEEQI